MKCSEFLDRTGGMPSEDMKRHMAECPRCAAAYETARLLMPRAAPVAPPSLRRNVMVAAKRNAFPLRRVAGLAASVAAAVAVAVVVALGAQPSQARAAGLILDQALTSAMMVKTMVMKIDVRVVPSENFSMLDPRSPMITHTLMAANQNGKSLIRLERPGARTMMYDGTSQFLWFESSSTGMKSGKYAGYGGFLVLLADPRMTILAERMATDDKGVKYTTEISGNDIKVTAKVKGQGSDFSNWYFSRYGELSELHTRRELTFDKNTKLLKGMKIYGLYTFGEVLLVDVKSILYDVEMNPAVITALPSGYEWYDTNTPITSEKFVGISPEEAAKIIFTALGEGDLDALKDVFQMGDRKWLSKYAGIEVIRIGKAYQKGNYAGIRVPYEIRYPNGEIERRFISLRNDNQNHVWVFDGGM